MNIFFFLEIQEKNVLFRPHTVGRKNFFPPFCCISNKNKTITRMRFDESREEFDLDVSDVIKKAINRHLLEEKG